MISIVNCNIGNVGSVANMIKKAGGESEICSSPDDLLHAKKIILPGVGAFDSVYFHKQHSLPTVRARFQNVYGPGEILGAGQWRGTIHTVWRNVTPNFIYKSLKGETLPLFNG